MVKPISSPWPDNELPVEVNGMPEITVLIMYTKSERVVICLSASVSQSQGDGDDDDDVAGL